MKLEEEKKEEKKIEIIEEEKEIKKEEFKSDKKEFDLKSIAQPKKEEVKLVKKGTKKSGDTDLEVIREKDHGLVFKPVYKKYFIPGVDKSSKKFKEYDIEDDSHIDTNQFKAVGYNKSILDNDLFKKHYRRFYGVELENCGEYGISTPFEKYPVRRGKYEDNSKDFQIFESLRNQDNKIFRTGKSLLKTKTIQEIEKEKQELELKQMNVDNKSHGCFKGLVRILEKNKLAIANKKINELTKINKFNEEEYPYFYQYHKLSTDLLSPKEVIIRIYILELYDIKELDLFSPSDPYLKLHFGDQVIDDQKNYQNDKVNCGIYKMYQMQGKLPGASNLRIELFDYDPLFSDDLIGYTNIDIEDRFYDKKWRDIKFKPIETRKFIHDDMKGITGKMTMWLEVFVEKDRKNPIWDISPPPTKDFEIRVIVWETRDIPMMDVEETSDIYVSAIIDDKVEKQSTDVHYRCQTGSGSFNWRILLPVSYQTKNSPNHILKIQVYDNDLFSKDDFICSNNLDLKSLFEDVYLLDLPLHFSENYYEALIKDLTNPQEILKAKDINFDDPDTKKKKKKFWLQMYQHNDVFI